MLLNLRIRDFAIIDEADVDFDRGFTVVTGETGAGKSILVDALMLALGARASTDVVRTGADIARVEALFDIGAHPVIRARLEQRELVGDDSKLLLVSRVIGRKGRARVLINGHLSTVATLTEIVRGLVDISGQHEQQSLLMTETHLGVLDGFGALDEARANYRKAFDGLRAEKRELDRLRSQGDADLQHADFLRFQLEEIDRIGPEPGEDERLEQEHRRLSHADKLVGATQLAEALLYAEDGSAFDKLGKAIAETESICAIDESLAATHQALEGARTEIEEAARTLAQYGHRVEVDPIRLAEVEDRQAQLRRLARKYGGGLDEVIAKREEIYGDLMAMDHSEERILEVEAAVVAEGKRARKLADSLTKERERISVRLRKAIEAELADMELGRAAFVPEVVSREGGGDDIEVDGVWLGATGADKVEFMWSANPGEVPRPLAKIASGGELSRVMLAVKRILCSQDLVSLYVFDEVDTGLGGKAADSIGKKIQAVASGHQAIAITHLAPIAARADHHIYVTKDVEDERTVSQIERLSRDGRAAEIARMIDGAEVSEVTRAAAREMLSRAQSSPA